MSTAFESARLLVPGQAAGLKGTGFLLALDPLLASSDAPGLAASVAVTIPAGYRVDLGSRPGTTVGVLTGAATRPGSFVHRADVQSALVVEDPQAAAGDAAAQACAPGLHTATWQATVTAFGAVVRLPIAVDRNADGSTTLRLCPIAAARDAPPDGFGLYLLNVRLSPVAAPGVTGTYTWSGLVIPTGPDLSPDATRAFELRARSTVPNALTLDAVRVYGADTVELRGRLFPAREGVAVTISASHGNDFPEPVGATTTDFSGSFRLVRRVTRSTFFSASVELPQGACGGSSSAPGGCLSETVTAPADAVATVVVPRSTDPRLVPRDADQALADRAVLRVDDLPNASVQGERPLPCATFRPRLHELTQTGDSGSPELLTGDADALVSDTAAVFRTTAEAVVYAASVGRPAAAACDAVALAGTLGHAGSPAPFAFATLGDDTRAYRTRVTLGPLGTAAVDLVVVRKDRLVITLHATTRVHWEKQEVQIVRLLLSRAGRS